MIQDFVFTSESVAEGHPDKLCDQISDAIVDAFLRKDPYARVTAECAVATGILFIATNFVSRIRVDLPTIARQVIERVGYTRDNFNARTCSIMTSLSEMPAEEYAPVEESELDDEEIERIGAQHQVTAFGYACTQAPSLMPLPIVLAHRLARRMATVRLKGELPWLEPDCKCQVAVEYRNRRPYRIHSITLIAALDPDTSPTASGVEEALRSSVIQQVFAEENVRPDGNSGILINPNGPFYVGGPSRHAGLTGRKDAVDTYGEFARHSGSALSGKDPSRIDRVGAYAARFAAKNIVAAGLAEACEVQLCYTIGRSRPVSIQIETFGTARVDERELVSRLEHYFDFRPAAILRDFKLRRLAATSRRGFFAKLAAYGQIGRLDIGLPWELTEKAALLRK